MKSIQRAAVGALLLLAMGTVCGGEVSAAPVTLDIKSQPMADALNEWAQVTGRQLIFPEDAVTAALVSPAVRGRFAPDVALTKLIANTGLEYEYLNERTVSVRVARAGKESERPVERAPAQSGRSRVGEPNEVSGTSSQQDAGRGTSVELDEIVVTATKRTESIQDVALSLSTLSADEIDHRGLVGMGDYLNSVPGVTMHDRGAARHAIIFRGASVNPEFEVARSGSRAVGVYFGDVPLAGYTRAGSSDIKLVDMERVEVLRGPQGTLYGSGSLSGTIRNIPNAPNPKQFEAKVRADYSMTEQANRGNNIVQGVVNIPVSADKLAIRAVGYRYNNAGFIDNVSGDDPRSNAIAVAVGLPHLAANQKNIGEDTATGGRFSILWKPTDNTDAQFSYIKQQVEQDGLPEIQLNRSSKFEQTRFDISDFVSGGERLRDDLDIYNLVLSHDFGWSSVYSSSSWLKVNQVENRDVSSLFPQGSFLGDLPLPQATGGDGDIFSQEIRFVSNLNGPMQFLSGLYYENTGAFTFENTFVGTDPAVNPFGNPAILLFDFETDLEQWAFFGETSYSWKKLLTLTVGTRVFDYTRKDIESSGGAFGSGTDTVLKTDEQDETFKVNVSYTPSESAHIYAQWAEGFRLGRGSASVPPSLCDIDGNDIVDGTDLTLEQTSRIKSDTMENYELGGKFAWLDNRLTTNLSIYQANWDGLALGVATACGLNITANAGKARLRGVEFEGIVRLTQALRMNFASSVSEGELRDVAQGVPAQVGQELPGSADINLSIGFQYDFPLVGHDAFIRGDYSYVGGYFNNLQETGKELGDYHVGNLRFGISMGQLDLQMHVNNVADSDGLVWTSPDFFADQRGVRLRPRTFGLSAQYNF